VDLDTGWVLGMVDGRDHKGVGDWLFARPLAWLLGVQVVAIDPSAAFRIALRMWLPRAAVAVDHFHVVSLANQTVTRQNLSQQVKGSRGRAVNKAWVNRMLLLRAGDTLRDKAAHRLEEVFAAADPTGTLQAVSKVKEQLRVLLRTGWRTGAMAKNELDELVTAAARPETNRLYPPSAGGGERSRCSSSPVQQQARSKLTTPRSRTSNEPAAAIATRQLQNRYSLEKCRPDGGMTLIPGTHFPTNREEPSTGELRDILRCP